LPLQVLSPANKAPQLPVSSVLVPPPVNRSEDGFCQFERRLCVAGNLVLFERIHDAIPNKLRDKQFLKRKNFTLTLPTTN